jgi:hypothetical protein
VGKEEHNVGEKQNINIRTMMGAITTAALGRGMRKIGELSDMDRGTGMRGAGEWVHVSM